MTPPNKTITRRDLLRAAGGAAVAVPIANVLFPTDVLAQTPKKGGKIVYTSASRNSKHKTLDKAKHPYFGIEIRTTNVYDRLTWVNEELEVEPQLATRWESVSDDQKVWEVEIREGVTFSDGRELTVDDVVSSYEFHKHPKLGTSFARKLVETVEKIGPSRMRFRLSSPNSELPWWMAEYRQVIMPADEPEKIGYSGVGTGPFKFAKIDPQRRVVYEANENYWGDGPYLDTLECIIQKGMDPLSGYMSGQFDVVASLDPSLLGQLTERSDTKIDIADGGDQYLVVLPKHEGSPFLDKRIRQALTLAIDRDAVLRIVYAGQAGWASNDSHMAVVNQEFLPRVPLRDVAKAKQLLAEAGHANGITLPTLYFAPYAPEIARMFQVVSESVKEAGITLPIEERPLSGYRKWRVEDKKKTRKHRFAMGPAGPRNAAANMYRMARPTYNESGYWHPSAKGAEYIALYEKAMVTGGREERLAIYQEMQRLLQEEVPTLFIAGRREIMAMRKDVQGLRAHAQHWSFGFNKVSRS